ncbi:MAG: helicase C-terminal domain-containing protein [Anaerolineales bacterium]
MASIVALDLETTGLDPENNAIIEIGAIRFNNRRVEEEFETLIRPPHAIPQFITNLTGISNQMVQNSPSIEDVLPELEDFVADLPILGHNVKFDVGFLRHQGLFRYNDTLDTYDMASVLLPGAGRYNLGALGQYLGIPFLAEHRALGDARVTQAIFLRMQEIAKELPVEILAEIVRMSDQVNWGADYLFREALKERGKELAAPGKRSTAISGPLFTSPAPPPIEPREMTDKLVQLDAEEVSAILDRGGLFSKHFPQFEHRQEQIELCQTITNALSEGLHVLAEAGTGVGKSLAYLVPAAIWAVENNTRVVVALRRRGPETADEVRVIAKMLIWLSETEEGDLSEINIVGPIERAIWSRISASDEGCSTETCVRRMGGICPFFRAKQAAHQAHILVVNHALLLADIATGNRVLPEYDYLIIDEGHHLEAATTSALSFRVTQSEMERTLRQLGGSNSGELGSMLTIAQEILNPDQIGALTELVKNCTDKAYLFQNQAKQFFIALDAFLTNQRGGRQLGSYSQRERIVSATRTQPDWNDVEVSWEDALHALDPLMGLLENIGQALGEMTESGLEEIEDLLTNINQIYRRLAEYQNNINALVFEPQEEQIYWVEISPKNNRLTLEAAPLHIGHLMERYLWHEKSSVVVTSATLTTNGEFDYILDRLSAHDADTLALGSPYDYERSTLLYIPNNIPEPSDRNGHQRAIERGLVNLCKATGGRTLALFTSYTQLQATSRAISPQLAEQGIVVFEQGQGASPHALLESFKSADQAVLLGTRAFWEGVDVPGEALSVLAIIKLPFAVPSDPVIAARSETFENPFYQYTIPEAILTFRQGFGRLIRSHEDHGIVAIFDKRVLTKQYGRMFIESLPTCTVEVGPIEDLPRNAANWLGV